MNAVELGATLYVPATNPAARTMAYGAIDDLRSMVVCLEDSVRDDQVDAALDDLAALLKALVAKSPTLSVYVRPRDFRMLTQLLKMKGIDRIDGFVLPKVTTTNQLELCKAIHHERHVELALEFDRFYDLVRWQEFSIAGAEDGASAVLGNKGYTAKNKYLPLPQEQVDASNGVLVQNPDYAN